MLHICLSHLARAGLAAAMLAGLSVAAVAADDQQVCQQLRPGSRDAGLAACTRAIASGTFKGTDLAQLHLSRGMRYLNGDDYDHAIPDFDQAIQLDPKLDRAYTARGYAWQNKGDNTHAIADYDQAIALNPDEQQGHYRRGVLRWRNGDYDAALADLEVTIRVAPKFASGYAQRGWVYHLKHDEDRAIADATTALGLNPKLDWVYSNRGISRGNKGDPDGAIADFDQALQLNPDNGSAHFNRGLALTRKGDYDGAVTALSASIRLKNNVLQSYANRGLAQHMKRDEDSAIADETEALKLNPKYDFALYLRGQAYQAKGDNANATADYDAAININPRYVNALNGRALLRETNGDLAGSLADFKAALAVNPSLAGGTERVRRIEEKMAAPAAPPAPPAATASATPANAVATAMDAVKAAVAAPTETRVALVIGNGAYEHVPQLPNPPVDATKIAETLKAIGFNSVTLKLDLTRGQIIDALKVFARDAAKADWAVLYFAGHGMEFSGNNYLIPVEAELASDRDVTFEAVSLDQALLSVEGAHKLRIVILDACRDNPFTKTMARSEGGTRGVGSTRGLAPVEPEGATLVAYAAAGGQYAIDGQAGGNSPFATALIKNLQTPGMEIGLFWRRVRDDVLAMTNGKQKPFTYGSVSSEQMYFKR